MLKPVLERYIIYKFRLPSHRLQQTERKNDNQLCVLLTITSIKIKCIFIINTYVSRTIFKTNELINLINLINSHFYYLISLMTKGL